MLDAVDLTRTLSTEAYREEEAGLRDRLAELQRAAIEAGLPLMMAFEGWDAAGKGSSIHALTARLDPRGFTVHPIRAPRPFEAARPWLWRYWRKIPAHGEWAFYDRSWYGRVLVQRIDKLVSERQWTRAYDEILQFERALVDDGYLLVKIFLHIDKGEQRRRLEALMADPVTAWRVTPEDWQNHHRYDAWLPVYDEALERTHTPRAPWTVIPATSPYYARRAVYRTLIDALEARLTLA
jgi:polyphosphate kinase 2 (PPK2 family)